MRTSMAVNVFHAVQGRGGGAHLQLCQQKAENAQELRGQFNENI